MLEPRSDRMDEYVQVRRPSVVDSREISQDWDPDEVFGNVDSAQLKKLLLAFIDDQLR